MNRQGPLFTLIAGLAFAVALLTLNATTGSAGGPAKTAGATRPPAADPSASPTAPASPEASASATATPKPPPDADYAGRTKDREATVAVAVRDGKAIAYVCDGRSTEAWLRGDVGDDGGLDLKGDGGARLTGKVSGGKVTGTAVVSGREWTFTAAKADKPAGLYRATATVRGAEVEGAWIVLQNGQQVGVVTTDGRPAAAPKLDVDAGTATVNGGQVRTEPVSGTTGQGGF